MIRLKITAALCIAVLIIVFILTFTGKDLLSLQFVQNQFESLLSNLIVIILGIWIVDLLITRNKRSQFKNLNVDISKSVHATTNHFIAFISNLIELEEDTPHDILSKWLTRSWDKMECRLPFEETVAKFRMSVIDGSALMKFKEVFLTESQKSTDKLNDLKEEANKYAPIIIELIQKIQPYPDVELIRQLSDSTRHLDSAVELRPKFLELIAEFDAKKESIDQWQRKKNFTLEAPWSSEQFIHLSNLLLSISERSKANTLFVQIS